MIHLNLEKKVMRKLMSAIPTIIFVCLLIWAWQPTFAGTWRDDFEDADNYEWEILNVDPQVERWQIDNGEAVGEIFRAGLMSLWLTGKSTWKNYSLSCQAKLVKTKGESPGIGLTLHSINEEDSRYLFFIDYVFDTVRIVKAVQDNWFPVVYQFDAEINTWYELTANIYEDGTLEFKIDDEVFTVIDDDPLKSGQAGLLVTDGQARFDNVEITGPNISDNRHGTDTPLMPPKNTRFLPNSTVFQSSTRPYGQEMRGQNTLSIGGISVGFHTELGTDAPFFGVFGYHRQPVTFTHTGQPQTVNLG